MKMPAPPFLVAPSADPSLKTRDHSVVLHFSLTFPRPGISSRELFFGFSLLVLVVVDVELVVVCIYTDR